MNVSLLFFNNNFRTHQIPRHHEHWRRRRICSIFLHLQLDPLIICRILFNLSSCLLIFQERHNLSLSIAVVAFVVVTICIPLFLCCVRIPLFICLVGVNKPWRDRWMTGRMDGCMTRWMDGMLHDVLYYM